MSIVSSPPPRSASSPKTAFIVPAPAVPVDKIPGVAPGGPPGGPRPPRGGGLGDKCDKYVKEFDETYVQTRRFLESLPESSPPSYIAKRVLLATRQRVLLKDRYERLQKYCKNTQQYDMDLRRAKLRITDVERMYKRRGFEF